MHENRDETWGALVAGMFHLRWILRWLILSALLLGLHFLLGTPWWLALLPPAYSYGRVALTRALIRWARKAGRSSGAVSLKGSLLKAPGRDEEPNGGNPHG